MKTIRFIYWQEKSFWLGYLEEFPDYMTQGENFEDLNNIWLICTKILRRG